MKRIAVSTGGGDAPGLNAVIRAVVKTAVMQYGWEVYGVRDGLDGFLRAEGGVYPLGVSDVRGILPRGGTILGAANRGNPFARRVMVDGEEIVEDARQEILDAIRRWNFDALVLAGGDGTLTLAQQLSQEGFPVIGVPKTIDNDVYGTDFTFGFDTAVNTAMEAIDRLHSTAEAHHRVMVLELMGRDAGFIALHAGLAGGADVILLPEIPFRWEPVCEKVNERRRTGHFFSIIVVAEGAHEAGGQQSYVFAGDHVKQSKLGGIGQRVTDYVANSCRVETRLVVLGHLQRGGSPLAFDRVLATRLGSAAVRTIAEGRTGRMVALRGTEIVDIDLSEAAGRVKSVDVHGDAVRAARATGISLGDE